MFTLCCFVLIVCRIITGLPAATIHDQRQTGDLNVQVELKDVQVVALLKSELFDDYTDYDYFYDYADFTIKPSNKPTTSSTTQSIEINNVTEIAETSLTQNSTTSSISTSPDDITSSTERLTTLSQDEEIPNAVLSNSITNLTLNIEDTSNGQLNEENGSQLIATSSTVASPIVSSTLAQPVQNLRSRKRCKSGYVPDGNGHCRRLNGRWLLPFSMIVPFGLDRVSRT